SDVVGLEVPGLGVGPDAGGVGRRLFTERFFAGGRGEFDFEAGAGRDNNTPLDDVLELAHIPRPVVPLELFHGRQRHAAAGGRPYARTTGASARPAAGSLLFAGAAASLRA